MPLYGSLHGFLAEPLPGFLSRVITSFDVQYTNFWQQNDPEDELPTATVVDDLFLDTGIDALPDGFERTDDGGRVTLDQRIMEFAIIVTARHWTSQYEWYAHCRLALAAGLEPRIAEELAQGRRPAGMKPDEEVAYDFCTELHRTHKVSDATWGRTVRQFGEAGAVDLMAASGYYTMVSMILNVNQTPLPAGVAPIPEL